MMKYDATTATEALMALLEAPKTEAACAARHLAADVQSASASTVRVHSANTCFWWTERLQERPGIGRPEMAAYLGC